MNKKFTVFVGMSGGVDSSVSAALLKQQGYDVVGVFMKNWSNPPTGGMPGGFCSAEADFADVRAVCQHLDIPYYTFNFEKEYKKRVLDYFFAEYKAGRTPNPDVMCNKEIKFDLFLKKSLSLGADFISTGHYAQVISGHPEPDHPLSSSGLTRGSRQKQKHFSSLDSRLRGNDKDKLQYSLLKGNDPIKDQTYFLYNLTQEQLAKTLFPVGKYPKKQVRALAKKFKLPTATKKDSQGICFIGPVDVKEFLKTMIKTKTGKIVNQEGKVLGHHEGAWFYTIGQRRIEGLSGQSAPLYVIGTDIKKNLVIVGPDAETYGKGVVLENLHLIDPDSVQSLRATKGSAAISHQKIASSFKTSRNDGKVSHLTAKPRYGPDIYAGQLISKNKCWQFIIDEPQRALTPGQSLVIYDKKVCLGGGVIQAVIK